MLKQIIAVDLDDVLSCTALGWLAYSNKTWQSNLTLEDYDEDWVKVWGVNLPEALRRREMLFKSGLYNDYVHIKEARPVLEQLAKRYRLVVVTSRVEDVRESTFTWLETHFRGIFDEITFTGFYENHKYESIKLTKAGLLKDIAASYLIDDQPKHCIAAAESGIKALLFGEYPWNRTSKSPSGVVRVKDWPAVARYFDV